MAGYTKTGWLVQKLNIIFSFIDRLTTLVQMLLGVHLRSTQEHTGPLPGEFGIESEGQRFDLMKWIVPRTKLSSKSSSRSSGTTRSLWAFLRAEKYRGGAGVDEDDEDSSSSARAASESELVNVPHIIRARPRLYSLVRLALPPPARTPA